MGVMRKIEIKTKLRKHTHAAKCMELQDMKKYSNCPLHRKELETK